MRNGSLNGFVLSKWRFPGADIVFTFFLFGLFIPYQAVMIPLTQLFDDINFRSNVVVAGGLCVLLAVVLDLLVLFAQRLLSPWTRAAR